MISSHHDILRISIELACKMHVKHVAAHSTKPQLICKKVSLIQHIASYLFFNRLNQHMLMIIVRRFIHDSLNVGSRDLLLSIVRIQPVNFLLDIGPNTSVSARTNPITY